jgi:hypothetical protein
VAVFASAPGASGGPRPHSEEWTGKLVELLGEQRVAASAVKLGGSLEGDREQTEPALAKLAGGAAPAGVDILIAGAVELDRTTRVWLVAIDSRQGRQAARAAFEGEESGMNVARRAATELVKGMQVYWFDCDRGRLTASPLLVEGLRHPEDIRLLLEAFPGVPGIERARHTSTQVVPGGEMAGAEYQLFTSLDPAALEKALAGVKWHSPGGTASVVPGSPGRSLVRYESP